MEKNTEYGRYRYNNIPVIYFDFDSGAWEPVVKGDEQSRAAAKYKNQLDEMEHVKASVSTGLYESRTMRDERFAESGGGRRGNGKRKGLPRVFVFYIFLAVGFFVIWFIMQR